MVSDQSLAAGNEINCLSGLKLRDKDKESMRVPLTVAEIGLQKSETVEPDPVSAGVGNRRLHCLKLM